MQEDYAQLSLLSDIPAFRGSNRDMQAEKDFCRSFRRPSLLSNLLGIGDSQVRSVTYAQ